MRKLLLPTIFFVLTAIVVTAQDITITRRQADSLSLTLDKPLSDTDRLKTLLVLASFNCHQRSFSDSSIHLVRDYIARAERLNQKLNVPFFREQVQLIQSGLYKASGDKNAGKSLLSQLIEKLRATNNNSLLGSAYFEMSEYYDGDFLHETMLERMKYLKLAIAAFEQTNRFVDLARSYRFLADLHQMTNNNTEAFAEVRNALKYYDQAGFPEKQGALSLLGRLYYEQGDYKQSLNYALMALRVATNSSNDNVRLICQINNNIGYTYFKLNENKKALQYFMQALTIAENENDNATIYLLAANVVDTYIKQNDPSEAVKFFNRITKTFPLPTERQYEGGDFGFSQTYLKIYLALKQYDKAKLYCDQLIKQTKNPNINLYSLSLYYQLIGRYFIETSDYDNAKNYLRKDRNLLDSLKNLWSVAQNHELWFSLDTASGNYKEAISDLIDAHSAKDSIFDETKSKQIAQLEVEFETEKKEAQINFLNQKAVLENTKLNQERFVKNVTITGIILLLIIAALLYRQSSFRRKSNIIVTQKNDQLQHLLMEKEWLLKEVHHRVKNNLHTIICLLESQAMYLEKDALRAIETSQNRIFAMSLIHQKLYQTNSVATVDADTYISELANYLSESFGSPSHIRFQLQLEKIKLNGSQSIPLGLIINETVTNAFKYAFPNDRAGTITIEFRKIDNNVRLLIADNGIGMKKTSKASPPKSLGINLIRGLTSELQGTILFENDKGTRILIYFPIEELNGSFESSLFNDISLQDIETKKV